MRESNAPSDKADIALAAIAQAAAQTALSLAEAAAITASDVGIGYSPLNAAYKSITGLDVFLATVTVTPEFTGKYKVRVSGSALNLKAAPQNLDLKLSHGVAPGAADFSGSVFNIAPTSASVPVEFVALYTTPFALGTPVQFNIGGIVGDAATGFAIGINDIQIEAQELPV